VFDGPQQFRSQQSADDADHACISGVERQPRPSQLAAKQPQADQCGHGYEDTEARHLERADLEQDGIHQGPAIIQPTLSVLSRPAVALERGRWM
jgi:hypothetical protein